MAKYKNVQSVDEKTMALAQDTYTDKKLAASLEKLGIHLDGDEKTPMSADAPRVFAVKDGKALTLEEGGMKQTDSVQLAFKREADPQGLLNPGKMIAWENPDYDYRSGRTFLFKGLAKAS